MKKKKKTSVRTKIEKKKLKEQCHDSDRFIMKRPGKILKKYQSLIMKYKEIDPLPVGTLVDLENNGMVKNTYRVWWRGDTYLGCIHADNVQLLGED